MTNSLMRKLFETLPLAGVEEGIGGISQLNDASQSEIFPFLQSVPPGKTPGDVRATPTDHGDKVTNQNEPLWSLSFTDNPTEVTALDCAVRAHKFANVRVAESVRFGYEPRPSGGVASPIEPHVRCTTTSGTTLLLPLTNDFLFQTWQTNDGGVSGSRALWRFKTNHDVGVVRVFVYDLPFVGSSLSGPYPIGTQSGATELAQIGKLRALCGTLQKDSGVDEPGFGRALLSDTLLEPTAALDPQAVFSAATDVATELLQGNLSAIQPGEVARIVTGRVRIVVVCSVLCCKETNDFQPGSPAGVARIFPHVHVTSTAPWAFKSFECTVQINRPEESTHHLGCHEMNKKVRAMLVTDTNIDGRIQPVLGPPISIWANLFNYYVAAAEDTLGFQPLHVVNTGHVGHRAKAGLVHRKLPSLALDAAMGLLGPLAPAVPNAAGSYESDIVSKFPNQGEFDNVHLAPTMRLAAAKRIEVVTHGRPTDPVGDGLEEVGMAPLCTHDCFHVHWRWTDAGPDTPQMGWSSYGPNSSPGATMVPPDQDVWIWLRGGSKLSYHAVQKTRGWRGDWISFFHHGGAILVELDSIMIDGAKAGMAAFATANGAIMRDGSGLPITPLSSLACFYWWNRHTITQSAEVQETTRFIDLEAARKL